MKIDRGTFMHTKTLDITWRWVIVMCTLNWSSWSLEIGVYRCVHTPEEYGLSLAVGPVSASIHINTTFNHFK
jgi:hypothetical protein